MKFFLGIVTEEFTKKENTFRPGETIFFSLINGKILILNQNKNANLKVNSFLKLIEPLKDENNSLFLFNKVGNAFANKYYNFISKKRRYEVKNGYQRRIRNGDINTQDKKNNIVQDNIKGQQKRV